MDAYNQAIKYLREKYNNESITKIANHLIDNDSDRHIYLLLKQYYYGIEAKKELSNIMNDIS